jgi:type II secretory pathway pseudopilin PulG
MRCHPGTRAGFTWVEALTVVAIIVILLGVLFPASQPSRKAAAKSSARNDMVQLATAVNAFYIDYGFYPIDPEIEQHTSKDVEYGAAGEVHNQDVINVLRADTNPADILATSGSLPIAVNTKQVVYLDVPPVKDNANPRSGLSTATTQGPHQNGKAGDWYDPWGAPYIVAIDGSKDGYIQLSSLVLLQYQDLNYITNHGAGNAVQAGCIAGSFGADHAQGTAGNKKFQNSDDVLSWQ